MWLSLIHICVTPISGHEEESRKVIAAVQAALHEGFVAAEPVITITPKQGNYSNDDKVTVEITCATEEVEIYYVVDNSNDITGGRLSDFEKHKVLYEKPLTLTIENPQGGTLYPVSYTHLDHRPEKRGRRTSREKEETFLRQFQWFFREKAERCSGGWRMVWHWYRQLVLPGERARHCPRCCERWTGFCGIQRKAH